MGSESQIDACCHKEYIWENEEARLDKTVHKLQLFADTGFFSIKYTLKLSQSLLGPCSRLLL